MPSFEYEAQPPINPFTNFWAGQRAADAHEAAQNTNQLASQTLGSNTQISANLAQSTGLANQLATQLNPLEIMSRRQQLGLDGSPALDGLTKLIGQPSSQGVTPDGTSGAPGGAASASPVRPFVATNLPPGIDPVTDQIVRTVYGEARGESPVGQRAVASVIRNRVQQSGMDPTGVIFAPGQFEPWNNPKTRAKLEALDPASSEYQSILANIRPTLDGTAADPTGGATHFYSPTAQAALGRQPPSWGQGPMQVIGGHQFYKLGYAPGSGAPGAPPAGQQADAPTQADANQPPGQNHPAQPVVQALAAHLMAAPPDQRPALYAQLRPAAIAAGATAPEQYPGDDVIGHLAGGGWGHPSATAPAAPVQVAGPGAPTVPDPAQPMPAPAAQQAPQQGVDDVMARLRAAQSAPPIPNQNDMFSVGAPDGVVPAAPLNGMAGSQARPQLMPAASAQPPAPAQPAQTGMNAPQVQQALGLQQQAANIEMYAARYPNNPQIQKTAAAAVEQLKARAAILMQADSVTKDPVTGVQRHALTGKEDNAATPAMNYQPDPNNPGVLVSPGQKPVVLPPGRASTLPDGSTWITGPGGTFKEGRGPNLEGASAAATAAAGGTAAAASAAKTRDALVPLARTSVQAISNIDYGLRQLDEAAKGGIPTGYFAPALATAAAAAKSLDLKIPGVDPAAVSNIQTASKTLAVVSGAILQNIIGKGEITDGKIEAFIHAQPGIVNDPLATHRILNWARSQFTYDHEMAMDGLAHVDPNSGQLPPGWQAGYITKHGSGPIFDHLSGEMKQPDGQAPSREPPVEVKPQGPPPNVSSAADHQSLTPGTTYVDPQGNTRMRR